MNKILIIDGNNLLFQMFYGMPTKIYNKSGTTIHATIGFISYVIKQVQLFKVNRVAVVFDDEGSNERIELNSEYKQNRITNWAELQSDEIPFNEEANIVKCLKYLGITPIYSKGMEADDVIASLAKLFENDAEVLISSFDSDFFQLINERVNIVRYRGKATIYYDLKRFVDEFQFMPTKYVLYKALVGDISDNIKGVSGIGKVYATQIVRQIDTLLELKTININEKINQKIIDNIDLITRNCETIALSYRPEVKYMLNDFLFNEEKMKQTNSAILTACQVFD